MQNGLKARPAIGGTTASAAAQRILGIRGSPGRDDWQGGRLSRVGCGPTNGPQDYADQAEGPTAAILMPCFGRTDLVPPKVSIIAKSA
jgi:hypothetical protein